jgi:hypothetical protein
MSRMLQNIPKHLQWSLESVGNSTRHARDMSALTSDELDGRLAALELALVIALEGRRLNPEYARAAVEQETTEGRLPQDAYISQKLTRPLSTKDGGVLHTVLDARAYMLALSKDREHRTQWQRAAELLLDGANVADFSKAVELALFFDAKLDLAGMA